MATTKHIVHLAYGEWIVAAVPQRLSGPGWGNSPIVVYIASNDGKLRECYLQPEEQTAEQHLVFGICAEAHRLMLSTIPVKKAKRTP